MTLPVSFLDGHRDPSELCSEAHLKRSTILELATAAVNVFGAVLQVSPGALTLIVVVRHVKQK